MLVVVIGSWGLGTLDWGRNREFKLRRSEVILGARARKRADVKNERKGEHEVY